jgi:hypothetical protein
VKYDGYNKQFTAMDRDSASQLDDGGLYLVADSFDEDFLSLDEVETIEGDGTQS